MFLLAFEVIRTNYNGFFKTLKLYARTSVTIPVARLRVQSGLGYAVTVNRLPKLERHISYAAALGAGSVVHSIMETPIGAMMGRGNER